MPKGGNKVPDITQAEHIGPLDTGDNISAKRVAVYETNDGVSWVRKGTQLAVRIDDTTTANTTYIGKAPIGSATSSAVWQIAKLDTSSGLIKTWAAGSSSFNQVWNDRASLTFN